MFKVPEKYRITKHTGNGRDMSSDASYGNNGAFAIPIDDKIVFAIAADGLGWEHVSVSYPDKTPSWDVMCHIKNLFWSDEDAVIQFHPPQSQYVNLHPHCLHLWRPIDKEIALPPKVLIGF